jgi:hypothetical protein
MTLGPYTAVCAALAFTACAAPVSSPSSAPAPASGLTPAPAAAPITPADLYARIEFVASDAKRGRNTPSPEPPAGLEDVRRMTR